MLVNERALALGDAVKERLEAPSALLRCHMQAFDALGGTPIEILYDRMKTAVTGEDDAGHIVYNSSCWHWPGTKPLR